MKATRIIIRSAALALAGVTAPALAQTAPAATTPSRDAPAATPSTPALAAGATVYDTQGGTVGTVESLQGDFAVLATAKSKVRLPKSSFAAGTSGPMIAMTAAQLDQAAAQATPAPAAEPAAATKTQVAKGQAVADMQGGAVGTVSEVDAQFATVSLTTGTKVRLPVNAFGAGPEGALRVAMTAAQLSAAASAAGGGG